MFLPNDRLTVNETCLFFSAPGVALHFSFLIIPFFTPINGYFS